MRSSVTRNQMIIAKTTLSPREMDVALLARVHLGRNGICQTLGLSANSVKTIFKRIEAKLGANWRQDHQVLWPEPEAETEAERQTAVAATPEADENDDFENGYYHRIEQEAHRCWNSHQTSFRLLVAHSHPGKDVLHVASDQRFWLRPILTELEKRKYLKLLAVDWNETFSPAWLPLVHRGRKEIRAADYVTKNARQVIGSIDNYLAHRLQEYISELDSRLAEVRNATRHKYKSALPDYEQLTAAARASFELAEQE